MLIIHFCIKYLAFSTNRQWFFTDKMSTWCYCEPKRKKNVSATYIVFDWQYGLQKGNLNWVSTCFCIYSKFGVWYEYIYFNKWIHINGLSNVARCLSLRIYKHLFFTWFLLIKRPSKFDVFVKKRIRNFSGYCGL